jgi:hypothetical protein
MKHIKLFENFLNEETQFPAQFGIDEPVAFKTSQQEPERWGTVVKVSFTKAKVWYDILDDYTATVISDVDSVWVKSLAGKPLPESFLNEAEDAVTLNVTISNIDQSTADDFLKMFAFMEYCGIVGTARTMQAFFDGDGHFRPRIKVEGIDLQDIDLGLTDEDKKIDLDLDFGA